MSIKNEKKRPLVPRLRFPKFKGAWTYSQLGCFLEEYSERVSAKTNMPIYSSTRDGLREQKEYFGGQELLNDGEYGVVPPGYFVYRHMSDDNIFAFNLNTTGEKIAVSKEYPIFSAKEISACFLYYILNYGSDFKHFAAIQKKGGTRTRLYFTTLSSWKSIFPTISEQQKIADCLSTLDERITAETDKLDALKAQKKGLLRQLFPADGETVPQVRFPEFQEAGKWAEISLGSLTTKVGSGITPTGGDKNYTSIGRPFIRSQNVGWGYLILDDVAYIDDNTHITFKSTEIIENDVLLNITGASIGRCAIADKRIEGGNVNQHVCIIRTKYKKINPMFLMQYVLSKYGQNQIDNFQAGGNRQGLNFAQVKSFSIPLPPRSGMQQKNYPEQQKIADCLSSLDELIAVQSQKIDLLKNHKRGLMQQLFPSTDEAQA